MARCCRAFVFGRSDCRSPSAATTAARARAGVGSGHSSPMPVGMRAPVICYGAPEPDGAAPPDGFPDAEAVRGCVSSP